MIEPEDDGCGDADRGHEGVRASIVAGCDPSSVFEASEHSLNFVAVLLELFIIRDGLLSVLAPRYAGLDPEISQSFAEPVAVIASISDQTPSIRKSW